jgi:hypothetical protein
MPCPNDTSTAQAVGAAVCLCMPGMAGSAASGCAPCPLGTYKDDANNTLCTSCPNPNTTTVTQGATSAAACVCKRGFVDVQGTCVGTM